ncbi:MAG: hypothetical protein RMJ82_07660 [Gemmatales bacterium]|nr:hypothetical protein [Gemmatales bacterium]
MRQFHQRQYAYLSFANLPHCLAYVNANRPGSKRKTEGEISLICAEQLDVAPSHAYPHHRY